MSDKPSVSPLVWFAYALSALGETLARHARRACHRVTRVCASPISTHRLAVLRYPELSRTTAQIRGR